MTILYSIEIYRLVPTTYCMEEEIFDIVDENNKVIGQETRSKAHSTGLFHRSVHILLFNSKGQIFIQKRVASKKIHPNKWDFSTAEHMKPGETYEQAAIRGAKEELGIDVKVTKIQDTHIGITKVGNHIYDREFIQSFKAISDEKITIDPTEVAEGRFFDIPEINKMVEETPEMFTPWFLQEWEELQKSL